jgi:hypothetical protein
MPSISIRCENASPKRTPARLGLFSYAFLSITALACPANVARSDDALEATCNLLKKDIGDCSCAIAFLTKNVGEKNALILMQGWAIAAGRTGDITGALGRYYKEHDQQEVLQASESFLKVRIQFYTHCGPPDGDLWDLN